MSDRALHLQYTTFIPCSMQYTSFQQSSGKLVWNESYRTLHLKNNTFISCSMQYTSFQQSRCKTGLKCEWHNFTPVEHQFYTCFKPILYLFYTCIPPSIVVGCSLISNVLHQKFKRGLNRLWFTPICMFYTYLKSSFKNKLFICLYYRSFTPKAKIKPIICHV